MILSDEEAKAVQEASKLGQKTIRVVEKGCGYLAKTFGEAIEQFAGAMADSAQGYRQRNVASVEAKTNAHLARLGVEDHFKLIDQRNAVPLIEAIAIEPDENIQEIWARYVANCLDPKRPTITVNRPLITVIKNLEPGDLPVIRRLFAENLGEPIRDPIRLEAGDFSLSDDTLADCVSRLGACGLFTLENDGSAGFAASEGYRMPCQLEVVTSLGVFRAQALLRLFQVSVRL